MILITGAAGKTGLALLRALARKGETTRALIYRNDQKGNVRDAGANEIVIGDIQDGDSLAEATDEVEAIYLICPNVHPKEFEMGQAVIAAASKQTTLPRIVYHSVMYPRVEAMPHHWQKWQVEDTLIRSGSPFTVLQPASYMQNILPYWGAIKERGEYVVPYSVDALFSPVDLADIAEAAVEVLTKPEHKGAIYQLCGSENLSSAQMAEVLSQSLGREVKAIMQDIEDWQRSAIERGMSAYALDALTKMFRYYDKHGFTGSSTMLENLLGRPPRLFSEFLSSPPK